MKVAFILLFLINGLSTENSSMPVKRLTKIKVWENNFFNTCTPYPFRFSVYIYFVIVRKIFQVFLGVKGEKINQIKSRHTSKSFVHMYVCKNKTKTTYRNCIGVQKKVYIQFIRKITLCCYFFIVKFFTFVREVKTVYQFLRHNLASSQS